MGPAPAEIVALRNESLRGCWAYREGRLVTAGSAGVAARRTVGNANPPGLPRALARRVLLGA